MVDLFLIFIWITVISPDLWKVEFVTVIPKTTHPSEFTDCRNISCTSWLSKLFEKFVLKWARQEVNPSANQYGGEKSCSTTHFLVNAWNDIMRILEDNRAAAILTSIDYSKAFNRLDHAACLRAFAAGGGFKYYNSATVHFSGW